MSKRWTEKDIPEVQGRVAIVTGANTGIGLETARALAERGATVVLACRSRERGEAAVAGIRPARGGSAELEILDLADLDSVRDFAERFADRHDRLDLLINNAGVMVPPLSKTRDGFELQFGVNHLGHFALTAALIPLLLRTDGSRVVVVSSSAHRFGAMDFDNLNAERGYKPWPAYGASKLANLLFTAELQRRLERAGHSLKVTAAHPGWTATDLQRTSRVKLLNRLFAMDAPQGALPTLRAALDPDCHGGEFFGPDGLFTMRGFPRVEKPHRRARDTEAAKRLWEVSEQLTGASFDLDRTPCASA